MSDYIIHYGVLGMKWGVRKQPKSNPKRQSRREKAATKFQKKADIYQKKISDLQKEQKDSSGFKKFNIDNEIKSLQKDKQKALANKQRKLEGKLSTTQRNVALVTAAVALYSTYKLADSGDITRLVQKGKTFMKNDSFDWKKDTSLADKNLSADEIYKKIVPKINPDFGDLGTKNNCRRCTFAYELSRRGYDVKATKSMEGTGQTAIGLHNTLVPKKEVVNRPEFLVQVIKSKGQIPSSFKGGKDQITGRSAIDLEKTTNKAKSIINALSENPNSARGELSVAWDVGGGHSLAWEIVKGEPVIFDTQTRKIYDTTESLNRLAKHITAAGYTRLDNVDLNSDFLLKWVQNA